MVKVQRLLVALFAIFVFTTVVSSAIGQRQYRLEHEWAKIWINQDGTIDLLYDINMTLDSGDDINYILVGQPKGDFTIGTAMDQSGHILTTTDASEGDNYKVRVNLNTPLRAGQTIRFNLTTNVAHMIWQDEDNPGNVGMQFTPTWWSVKVEELRVLVVLPQGVTKENVRCIPEWENAFNDTSEDNRFVIYWERHNLQPNQKFPCGVSFPKEYIDHYEMQGRGLDWGTWLLPVVAFVFIVFAVGIVVYRRVPLRKYVAPNMRMETLGIRHGLTAVEASHLLGLPPAKIVTEIL